MSFVKMTGSCKFEEVLALLCCPTTRSGLTFHRLSERSAGDREDGLLVSKDGAHVYPVLGGVPVMLPKAIPTDFAETYREKIQGLGIDAANAVQSRAVKWSFSDQWAWFGDLQVEKTWGWSTQSRVEMFFLETQKTPKELADAVVLDAGCGNGLLTEALGAYAKLVIGMDYSDSVFDNAARCRTPNVWFIKGDIQNPPFRHETLDIVVSNGVLHHTPSARGAFEALAPCVVDNGSFYIWLYRHSAHGNVWRRGLRHVVENLRRVVAPLPRPLRVPIVYAFAGALMMWTRLKGEGGRYNYSELVITAHDSLTPKYRTLHTPNEVAEWYFECGFGPPTVTHWDNRTGFGVVGRRVPHDTTPGVNFGRPRGTVKRYGL